MDKRKGFTLIELLVVISIIAMLMAILIPALRAAKAAATGVVCVSNVHNLSIAWFQYIIDNDNRLVGGDILTNNSTPSTPAFSRSTSGQQWVDPPQTDNYQYMGNSTDCTIEHKKIGIKRGALFPYAKKVELYHCKADKRYKKQPEDTSKNSREGGWRSYSIAGGLNGEHTDEAVKLFTNIKTPSAKYVFVEEKDHRGWNRGSWLFKHLDVEADWEWTDPVAVWHNKKSSLGFADGHSESHRWTDSRTIMLSDHPFLTDSHQPYNQDLKYMAKGYTVKDE